ncbi:hypothetical protein Golob_021376 [Gossypium lobatum]|uniref:Uncharacterized protein n=1 Tax=Gossypium lobatum TaxID=34289 RepID=A0A7J8LDB7_9ROSI|nr:hypothetical protein [Gossypium lobatum]
MKKKKMMVTINLNIIHRSLLTLQIDGLMG